MAKPTGLGKGLGALLKETSSEPASISKAAGLSVASKAVNHGDKIPSCIEVDENGGLWVDPSLLIPNPKQPRIEFNQKHLEELSESIKNLGILQPIIIEQAGENQFYIIAGERRTRAARLAGLTKVPVQLRKFDEQQKLEMALIENIQRTDLNPIEEAMAYRNLVQMSDLTQEEVAMRVGKNRSTVANSIRLLNLPDDIQRALINGQLTSGHARALLSVKNDSDMRVLYGKIIGSGLSVRVAEEMAVSLNNGGRAVAPKKVKRAVKKDPDVALFEQKLKNLFGIRGVTLNGTIDKGSITLDYSSKNDFDRICDILKVDNDE